MHNDQIVCLLGPSVGRLGRDDTLKLGKIEKSTSDAGKAATYSTRTVIPLQYRPTLHTYLHKDGQRQAALSTRSHRRWLRGDRDGDPPGVSGCILIRAHSASADLE